MTAPLPARRRGVLRRPLVLVVVAALITALVAGALAVSGALRTGPRIGADLPTWDQLDTRWGTYLSEREWGTPREAVGGHPWGLDYLDAIRQEYRFSDDGIAGWTDTTNEFRMGWAFWDGKQPRVAERFFGWGNPSGDHGEEILDDRVFHENGPTHAYARLTYRYPLREPVVAIDLEVAKADSASAVFRATVTRLPGDEDEEPEALPLDVVFKAWLRPEQVVERTPTGLRLRGASSVVAVAGSEPLSWQVSAQKRALDRDLRDGALADQAGGHIGALAYRPSLAPGASATLTFAMAEAPDAAAAEARAADLLADAATIADARRAESDGLFRGRVTAHEDLYRHALMSLLWAKSYYAWDGSGWEPEWAGTVDARDVLIMPDKWEYPWLATWDTAFHAVAAAEIDPQLGADQLRFILSDRWQQDDGHLPCAEFVMDDECPLVFSWAALRVADAGAGDDFLEAVYPALVRSHDYWWSSHAVEPRGLFAGADPDDPKQLGFLGMDNLPRARGRAQADASGWMAFDARQLEAIARRLGRTQDAERFAEDVAVIAEAVNAHLWNEDEGFYFDLDEEGQGFIDVPSYSGLVPLIADIVPPDRLERVLAQVRDENAFLADGGLRSTSRRSFDYKPGYTTKGVNSSWLGPIWMPLNYLLVGSIERHDPAFAADLRQRLIDLVEADWRATGRIHEYFDGNTGEGLGADAQTGWTALVANLIREAHPAAAPG